MEKMFNIPLDKWNGKNVYGIDKNDKHLEYMDNHVDMIISLLYSAIEEGDYQFFDSDVGRLYTEFANQRCVFPLHSMRKKAKENFDNMHKDIFSL